MYAIVEAPFSPIVTVDPSACVKLVPAADEPLVSVAEVLVEKFVYYE